MTCNDKCIHFPVCEQKKYDFANIDECMYYQEEKPTGEWSEHIDYVGDTYYTCSNCGEDWTTIEGEPSDNLMNYCPKCGAKMKGGEEE